MGDSKSSLGLLNGIAKREYYDESGITDEFLHDQLYPDLSMEEFASILSKFTSLLKNIVYSNMDLKQLDAFLTSQKRKMPDFLTDEQTANITKFWKSNKQKIHDILANRSSWNNHLKSMEWRIDVNYNQDSSVSDNPSVIFSLAIDKKVPVQKVDMVNFEVSSEKLDDMVTNLEDIEAKLVNFVN